MALVAPSSLRALETFHSETHWLKEMAGRWAESGVWPKVFRAPIRGGQAATVQEEGVWKCGRGLVWTSLLQPGPTTRALGGGVVTRQGPPQASLTLGWPTSSANGGHGGGLGQKWRSAVLRLCAKGALSQLHKLILTFPVGTSQEPQEREEDQSVVWL